MVVKPHERIVKTTPRKLFLDYYEGWSSDSSHNYPVKRSKKKPKKRRYRGRQCIY